MKERHRKINSIRERPPCERSLEESLDASVGCVLIEWEEFSEGIRLAFSNGDGWFDVLIKR